MQRRDELEHNLAAVRERIARACEQSGRSADDVTLIVVTKTHPASDVAILAELGVTDVGENRHPEAGDKHREVVEAGIDLRWHFVGALQTNKAGAVARYADVVQSLDRPKLARALDRGAQAAGRTLRCLIQVDFDTTDPGRAGVPPQDVAALAEVVVSECPHLELGGVMTVAPLGQDPAPSFAHLREISTELTRTVPSATTISAGMSEDFETAIAHGATHVRVGRSVLGQRSILQ
ncbi:YggS family pyridoxal phosphate-dependent enzyme [Aeromicrobium duanguangcaii]|uniref:YggS family pyridoxal phosphate-dependent enzyme n=1 Tax=Aeromicrobium duanguangcaii TaxID=2968086 RepID=UPI0020173226|nr:YggS family pyridoxal phosphate-dependent enzyme [Aeromicrobium duanguangcaii]MCL3836758.1 YggS family pyridoxal phosphate-dependent enzyme [Aeromicrobium duanguangcaii]